MTETVTTYLQDKSFEFILDYLYCSPYSVYTQVRDDKLFMEHLRLQCTTDGFLAFEKSLNAYGEVIKEREIEKVPIPKMEICKNGEISIDGGKTRSQMRAQYKEKNPEVSFCILHYDIVWVNCYFNEIPYGSEGRVLDVCPPRSGTDVIHYLVEIPV